MPQWKLYWSTGLFWQTATALSAHKSFVRTTPWVLYMCSHTCGMPLPPSCKSQLCVHTLLIFVSDVFYGMLLCMCTTTLHHREYQFFTSSVHGGEQEGWHSFCNWARVLEHQEQQSWPKNFLSHKQTQSESLRCKHFPSCLISWSKCEGQFRVPVALQDSHFVDPAVTCCSLYHSLTVLLWCSLASCIDHFVKLCNEIISLFYSNSCSNFK